MRILKCHGETGASARLIHTVGERERDRESSDVAEKVPHLHVLLLPKDSLLLPRIPLM